MYANQTIRSYTRKVYASINDEITIISERGNVLIVESNGDRFPCLPEWLSEEKTVVQHRHQLRYLIYLIRDEISIFLKLPSEMT